jgi:hypothetical protein
MTEIRVWTAAVSASNISAYKNKHLDSSHPNVSSLVGYWKCDEGTGDTLYNAANTLNASNTANHNITLYHVNNDTTPSRSQIEWTAEFPSSFSTLKGLMYDTTNKEVLYSTSAKTFIIPHPDPEKRDKYLLKHVCIEAPTRGTTLYEFQITTTKDCLIMNIELPSYFKFLNGRPRVYVSATNTFARSYGYVNDELTEARIHTESPGTFNILITAVRKDPAAKLYSATEEKAEFKI